MRRTKRKLSLHTIFRWLKDEEKKKLFCFMFFLTLKQSLNVKKRKWWVYKICRKMSKRILTKSIMIYKKIVRKDFPLIGKHENDWYLYLFFPSSIFLYLRSSAFFIDHCGNEIIPRTSDQTIEKEWKKTSRTTTEKINKSFIEKKNGKNWKKEKNTEEKRNRTEQNITHWTFCICVHILCILWDFFGLCLLN
jgi:hypothetical protein